MAIGVPDFNRGAQSPIDLAFALDRRQRAQQGGGMFDDPLQAAFMGMNMNERFGGGQPAGPQGFGPLAGALTIGGGGGVSMPGATSGGLPASNPINPNDPLLGVMG